VINRFFVIARFKLGNMSAQHSASSSDAAAAAQQRRRQQLETQIAIDELRSLKPSIGGGGAGGADRPPAVYEQRSNGVLFLSSQREMLAKKTGAISLACADAAVNVPNVWHLIL
jgi:hypothetical protein